MLPERYMLPCAYKQLFGADCPMCGFQRSFILLCKTDFAGSFKMYPPLIAVLLLIILSAGHLLNRKAVNRKILKYWSVFTLTSVAVNYFIKTSSIQS